VTEEGTEDAEVAEAVLNEAPVSEESDSTFRSDPEFVWDLHEFPNEPKKTEDIDFKWKKDSIKIRKIPSAEFFRSDRLHVSDDLSVLTPIVSEEDAPPPEILQPSEIAEIAQSMDFDQEITEIMTEITIEEIKEELQHPQTQSGDAGKIDKFYTFNKKNEEFQKLLDKEYERVKNKELSLEEEPETFDDELTEPVDFAPLELWGERKPPAFEEAQTEPVVNTPQTNPEEAKQEEAKPSKIEQSAIETIIFDNDALSKRFDTKEFNADLIDFALQNAGIKILRDDIESSEGTPKPPSAPEAEQAYESGFKPKFITELEEDEQQELIEEMSQGDLERSTIDGLPVIDPQKQQAFKALEQMWDSAGQGAVDAAGEKASAANKRENAAGGTKKGMAIKVLLILLIVILALQIAILGIIHMAPESRAAEFINRELGFAVMWFNNIRESGEPDQESPQGGRITDWRPFENNIANIDTRLFPRQGYT